MIRQKGTKYTGGTINSSLGVCRVLSALVPYFRGDIRKGLTGDYLLATLSTSHHTMNVEPLRIVLVLLDGRRTSGYEVVMVSHGCISESNPSQGG